MAFSATTMMLIGQYGPPTYVAIGAVAILMFILAYRCYISYRKRAAVTVNCWFCNTNHKVPYLQRNSWDCPSCEQYNGFTADGDYNKVIPAVCEDRKMYNLQSAQRYCEKTNGLCVECNRNQLLKIKQLASFVPNSEANFDTEVEQYQKHLESVYKLCPSCAAVVKRHLNQQNSKLSMMLAAAQRKAAGLLSPKSVSSTKAERRKRRRRWIKKDFAANFCHFAGFFLSLCLWVVALHQLQEDSHNEIIGLTYMLPDRLIQLLPQLSHSAGALVVVALFLEIIAGWRNRRSRFPITLDLLTGSVLLGATTMFLDVLAENLCSSREDRHIWQLCISTLVCFVVWCSAFVPRSKIHRNRIRLKTVRSRADMSVYSSICSTCSSPSPLPSLNNSCSNSTAGSGRDSPMDMDTCDVVTTHSALETLQIGPQIKLRNPIGSGNLRKPFSQPDFIRYSQSPSVVSSVSSFRSSSLSQPAHKPIIGPARISVSNYVPTGTFAMAPVAQPGWNSGFQRRSTFTFGQKSAFSSDSFSRGGSQDDDSRSVISNFSSVSGRMSPEKRSSPQPVANTQRLSSSESWWKLGIAAAVLVSLMTNVVVVYFVATKSNMRPLTDEETELVFTKLAKFVGDNVKSLIDRQDGTYCFRLHRDRIYYAREELMKKAACFNREHLVSFGTCFGKITKTRKFHLHITALDYLAPYVKYKVWVKPNAEQQFLYGHHVLKSGVGRITENSPKYQGVVVFNMADIPLGFGVLAKSTTDTRRADPTAIVVFNQADLGEYIRHEESLI